MAPDGSLTSKNECDDAESDQLDKRECADVDISGEADGANGGVVDDEPSLGSLDGRMSQLRWSTPDRSVWWPNEDMELDEADQEVAAEDVLEGGDDYAH